MSWRRLEVNGKEYRWRGSFNVAIQDSEGKRVGSPTLTAPELKRITEREWYDCKGNPYTTNGMLTPADIKNYILRVDSNKC